MYKCVCACVCVCVHVRVVIGECVRVCVCIKKATGGALPTHAHDDAQPLPLLDVPVAGDEARRGKAVHLCATADGCDMPNYTYLSISYLAICIYLHRYGYGYGYRYGYGYTYAVHLRVMAAWRTAHACSEVQCACESNGRVGTGSPTTFAHARAFTDAYAFD